MAVWHMIQTSAAVLAVGTMFWGQSVLAWGQEMNETLLDRFAQAYKGSTVDPTAVDAVYQRWIEFKLKSLGNLPASLRDEVMSGLVADRTRAIAESLPEARPMQLEYDRIWTELWPIDKQSEVFAQEVKQGHRLSDEDRAALQANREQLSLLRAKIGKLPPDLRTHFDEVVSESTLDIAYAIHDGSGPVSMRLGRSK
jgi:hypothetical protein